MMGTLIWKDIKLNRAPMVFAAILFVAPVVIYSAAAIIGESGRRSVYDRGWESVSAVWYLCIGAFAATLVVPVYGGISFARERRDRSAEFISMLPIQRWRIVVSKLAVAIFLSVLPWLAFAFISCLWYIVSGPADQAFSRERIALEDVPMVAAWVGVGDLCLFGVAWLLSCVLRSETIAAGASLVFTLILVIGTTTWIDAMRTNPHRDDLTARVLFTLLPLIGGVSLMAGTIVALRRRTP